MNLLSKTVSAAVAVLATVAPIAITAGTATVAEGAAAREEIQYGPPYEFTRALMDGRQVGKPLTNLAKITRSEHGYIYHAGSQDNRLVLTLSNGRIHFVDPATPVFQSLVRGCRKRTVAKGVAASCRVPEGITAAQPLLIEVWPRIGDDFLDASSLPETVAVTFLGDLGNDTARLGAGPDFFNGAFDRDRVWGGAGNDWLRTNEDPDRIWGGPGDDKLVGVDGVDIIYGGDGDDSIHGMDGDDILVGGLGKDLLSCGAGMDTFVLDLLDTRRDCESGKTG